MTRSRPRKGQGHGRAETERVGREQGRRPLHHHLHRRKQDQVTRTFPEMDLETLKNLMR